MSADAALRPNSWAEAAPSPRRCFTPEELDELCRPVVERLSEQLGRGSLQDAKDIYAYFEHWQREVCVGVFGNWSAKYQDWIDTTHGRAVLLRAQAEEALAEIATRVGATTQQWEIARDVLEGTGRTRARLEGLIDAGDTAGVLRLYREIEVACHAAFDLRRDWITHTASFVYREHGVDGLERSMRYVWNEGGWWREAMRQDLERSPRERARYWADLDVFGFFSTIRLTEDDEKIVSSRICGSCGLQQRDGRYEPPWNFAVVEERNPMTWMLGRMPVYRSHIALVHGIMPIETTGMPWPAVECSNLAGGRCTYTIYKDPRHTASAYYERVGKSPPAEAADLQYVSGGRT